MDATWVDFGSFWGGAGEAFLLIFCWFFYYFKEINVFEQERCPRAIRERKRCPKGGFWEAKWEPKSIKNRIKIFIDFWIDFGTILARFRTPGNCPYSRAGAPGYGSSRYFTSGKYDRIRRIRSFFNLREELIDPTFIPHGPFEGKRPD